MAILNKPGFEIADTVILDICAALGDAEGKYKYVEVARNFKRAMHDLNSWILPTYIRSKELTISSNMTVELPSDCLEVLKVGVCTRDGIYFLNYNNKLYKRDPKYFDCCDCGEDDNYCNPYKKEKSCTKCTFHNVDIQHGSYLHDGARPFVGKLYGLRPNVDFAGTWKHDQQFNRLIMGSGVNVCPEANIILEYKSDGGDELYALVPRNAFLTLRYRVMQWMNEMTAPNLAGDFERKYQKEYSRFKRLESEKRYSLKDIAAVFRRATISSPKR